MLKILTLTSLSIILFICLGSLFMSFLLKVILGIMSFMPTLVISLLLVLFCILLYRGINGK